MIKELRLRILPEEAVNEQSLRAVVCRETGENPEAIRAVRVLKRSIDARQRMVYANVSLRVFINEEPADNEFRTIEYKDVSGKRQAIVVGAGPGGLFAALRLIELGFCPVVLERGKNVHDRKKDIALISREHCVNPESNYCFGEGGAGAYSDGKLYARSKKRGSVDRILHIFCQHGAGRSILSDAHPHIGTDKLPGVIENMRNRILQSGGEAHFETCMESLIIKNDEVIGVQTRDGRLFMGPVILATGHSARDVYRYLASRQIAMEAKGIAVGVRLEHPQLLVDQIRYHNKSGRGAFLPAAEYRFVAQSAGRGVYSFCMCPGGFVVPAASGPEEVVVNGMSPSSRSSRWANSGMVVEIRSEDLLNRELNMRNAGLNISADTGSILPYGLSDNLSMMHFQERLERLCWINGGMRQTAPAQRMADFVQKRNSSDLPVSSYTPGLLASPLHFRMPEFITSRLRDGFRQFDKVSRGFLTNEACMIGVETRTSSPVRILRDRETMQHITLRGLYPCGEGAGYAGGIVSAAIDGELCAERVSEKLLFK
ncbi:MAG: FAD-binding protein [Tannerella sp.]|jgi:uncharacterized FAD-dependent dehydrogenase|nr:FAD-binding protein [Tannerella sp.]